MLESSAGKIILLLLVTCVFADQHCPLGQGFNSEGACSPCAIDHCGYCSDSQTLTCQACISPYQIDPLSNNCRCPTGQGPLQNGGCSMCQVLHCDYCSSPKGPICQVCKPNFTAKKTSSGVQCLCEAPFQINDNGECSCPPGQGYDQNYGCSRCSVNNCQICQNSAVGTCQKCFLTGQLSIDNSTCSCPPGQGPANGFGCAPCRPENCAYCSNSILNRCDVCAQNFTKVVTTTKTNCVCQSPFIIRADGRCVCPAGQGSDGQGGCTTCSISNCASCKISNFGICQVCLPTYTLLNGGTACGCLQGQGQLKEGGCAKCQVQNCVSCNNGYNNYCDQCQNNFVRLVTGNSTQCICKLPFYVNQYGVCGCPDGTYQSGDNSCSRCKVSNCKQCSNNGTTCNQCQETYLLSNNVCTCPSFEGPLNGHKCSPCADKNCLICSNSAVDVCSKCTGNFTLQVIDYDNQTDQVQSTICECSSPFIVDEDGNCICPLGKTINSRGFCQSCAVSGCSSCDQPNIKCSECFSPYVINAQGDSCVCPPGTGNINGSCVKCQIDNCLSCPNPNQDTCNECVGNYTLNSATHQKNVTISNQTKQVTMNTATCTCLAPFVINDNGQCTCPKQTMLNSEGNCVACSVQNCLQCSATNTCSKCEGLMILSQNSQCVCPQGYGINQKGSCEKCSLSNCLQCQNSWQFKCSVCATNFTLVATQGNGIQNHQCQCSSPYTLTQEGQCIFICPQGTVETEDGQCEPCEVNNCGSCPNPSQFICQACLSPYVLTNDNRQCSCPVGQGPVNTSCASCTNVRCASCPINLSQCYMCQSPYRLNEDGQCVCPIGTGYSSNGQCAQCKVSNCAQCQTSDSPQCHQCIYPSVLSSDGSKCQCPDGQATAPGGGCAPCKVDNCQQCSNSFTKQCIACKPTFKLSQTAQQCHCPNGQGPNTHGVCQSCLVDFCRECHISAFTCSICQHPFVSNSDGTQCICPIGQAPNQQGGCSKCLVDHCSSCPTSTQLLCDACYPMYKLGLNSTFCYWPNQNNHTCPPGQGLAKRTLNLTLETASQCTFCKVPYCLKCYADVETCSICQQPFVSNSDGTKCVCPRAMAPNLQGGCSYCQVSDCQVCSTSQSSTCQQCFTPFKLQKGNTQCIIPKKHHLLGFLWHCFSFAMMFMPQTPEQGFNLGMLLGLLVFPALIFGLIGLVYLCWSKVSSKKSTQNSANNSNSQNSISSERQYKKLIE